MQGLDGRLSPLVVQSLLLLSSNASSPVLARDWVLTISSPTADSLGVRFFVFALSR
jgi:hypothetical protein